MMNSDLTLREDAENKQTGVLQHFSGLRLSDEAKAQHQQKVAEVVAKHKDILHRLVPINQAADK